MKVIITGASGLLGRQIHNSLLQSKAFDPIGLSYRRSSETLRELDLCDFGAVTKLIDEEQPQAIIHAAAERRPEQASKDPEKAKQLNVDATQHLATLCEERDMRLLYISTDYVFDGTSPPYSIDSRPRPLNEYGQSKLDGEKAVEKNSKGMILRVPLLYGPVEYVEESAVTSLLHALHSKEEIKVDNWATRYPTYTCDVALACQHLLQCAKKDAGLSGIFHWSSTEAFTKYDLTHVIAELFNFSTDHIQPENETSTTTPRPQNCQLDCTRIENLGLRYHTPLRPSLYKALMPYISAN